MRRNPAWTGPTENVAKEAAKPIACLLFITALGVSFWVGALWVTLPLLR
jgi:hypothetical protein